jgi:hypothetical protein
MRPETFGESDKKKLLEDLPLVTAANRVSDRKMTGHLVARLQGALRLYGGPVSSRNNRLQRSATDRLHKPGVVVVLSTEVLKIVGEMMLR